MRRGQLINNPKKEISLDFTRERIIDALRSVSVVNEKYSVLKDDKVLNIIVLKKKGIVDIMNHFEFQFSFEEVSKNKTKMTIECSRFIGAFDTAGEITEATLFMDTILDAISVLLSEETIEEALSKVLSDKKEKQDKWIADTTPSAEAIKTGNIIIWVFAAAMVALCIYIIN